MGKLERAYVTAAVLLAACYFSEALGETSEDKNRLAKFLNGVLAYAGVIGGIIEGMEMAKLARGITQAVVYATTMYDVILLGYIANATEGD